MRKGGKSEEQELFEALRLVIGRQMRRELGVFDPDEVEDLIHETLAVVVQRLPDFKPEHPGAFRAWVREIARKVAANVRNKDKTDKLHRAVRKDVPALPRPEPSPGTVLDHLRKLSFVSRQLARLSTPLRTMLGHRLLGRTDKEAAELEGINYSTARSRTAEGIKKMRRAAARAFASTPTPAT